MKWDTSEAGGGNCDTPHGKLFFNDDHARYKININVRSKDRVDHRLVFWTGNLGPNTPAGDRLLSALKGFKGLGPHRNPPTLDILHDSFLDIRTGNIRDTNLPGPKNDITHDLDVFFNAESADFRYWTLFIWGEYYEDGGGAVHQVHMNQGNYSRNPGWYRENGCGQDGGIFMLSPDGERLKYFLIAFAGQASETDNVGRPKYGEATPMLRDVIGAEPPVTHHRPVVPGQPGTVKIHSALVNPSSSDTPEYNDRVRLINRASDPVSLDGWTIQNQDGRLKQLPDVLLLGNGDMRDIDVGPESYLANNRNGTIVLRDAGGAEISRVSYKANARSAQWIPFRT